MLREEASDSGHRVSDPVKHVRGSLVKPLVAVWEALPDETGGVRGMRNDWRWSWLVVPTSHHQHVQDSLYGISASASEAGDVSQVQDNTIEDCDSSERGSPCMLRKIKVCSRGRAGEEHRHSEVERLEMSRVIQGRRRPRAGSA